MHKWAGCVFVRRVPVQKELKEINVTGVDLFIVTLVAAISWGASNYFDNKGAPYIASKIVKFSEDRLDKKAIFLSENSDA